MHLCKPVSIFVGSKLGDVAAVIPNPERNLAVSKPTKYVTREGVEVSLDILKDQMLKENAEEQSDFNPSEHRPNDIRGKSKRKRLSCHMCNPPDCSDPDVCHGAISCYTSQLRDTEGHVHRSKGS